MSSEAVLTQARAEISALLMQLEPTPGREWVTAVVDEIMARFEPAFAKHFAKPSY